MEDEKTMKRQFRKYELFIEHLQNVSSIIKDHDINMSVLSTIIESHATILQLLIDILRELKGGTYDND